MKSEKERGKGRKGEDPGDTGGHSCQDQMGWIWGTQE